MDELIQKIVMEDSTFSESTFKAKADNIFIQLYTAVMKKNLERVKHFLSEEVYEEFARKVQNLNERNLIQIYGELNVSDTNIVKITENEDDFEIEISLLTKYLDYQLDGTTRQMVSGDDQVRKEQYMRMIFSKRKNAKNLGTARKCPGCGANMDIAINGNIVELSLN